MSYAARKSTLTHTRILFLDAKSIDFTLISRYLSQSEDDSINHHFRIKGDAVDTNVLCPKLIGFMVRAHIINNTIF